MENTPPAGAKRALRPIVSVATGLANVVVFYAWVLWNVGSALGWACYLVSFSTATGLMALSAVWTYLTPTEPPRPACLATEESAGDGYAFCRQCQQRIDPTTRHCRVCNRCTLGFDHHCGWINKCIGARNFACFVVMVLMTFSHLLVFALAATSALVHAGPHIDAWFVLAVVLVAGSLVFGCLLGYLICRELYRKAWAGSKAAGVYPSEKQAKDACIYVAPDAHRVEPEQPKCGPEDSAAEAPGKEGNLNLNSNSNHSLYRLGDEKVRP